MSESNGGIWGTWLFLFVLFSLLSLFTDHVQVGVMQNAVPEINGIQFALARNISNNVNGLQIAFNNSAINVNGAQIGMVSNARELNGFQLNLIESDGTLIDGIQIAPLNGKIFESSLSLNGIQFGFINTSYLLNGIQMAWLSNQGTSINGIQASFFLNRIVRKNSDKPVVNVIQIGLLNFVNTSAKTYCISDLLWGFFPIFNACASL